MKFKKIVACLLVGAMLATSVPSSALTVLAQSYTADEEGWWKSWTPGFEVPDGRTKYFSMEVEGGPETEHNVVAVFTNVPTDGAEEPNADHYPGYMEYAAVRSDSYGWSDAGENKSVNGKNIVYGFKDAKNAQGDPVDVSDYFVDTMKDAHIDAAISKDGDKITLEYDVQGANGISWTYQAEFDQNTDDGLYVFFVNNTSSVVVEDETKPTEVTAVAVTGDSIMKNVAVDFSVTTVPRLCDPSQLIHFVIDGEKNYSNIAAIDWETRKITFLTAGTHTITVVCENGEGESGKITTAETTVEAGSAPLQWVPQRQESGSVITDKASVYTVNHEYKTGSIETSYDVDPQDIQQDSNLIRKVYGLSSEEDPSLEDDIEITYTYQWYTAADNRPVEGAASAGFVPKDSEGIRYNTDDSQYYCIVTADSATINGDTYTAEDVVASEYSAAKTPLTLKYAVNYNYTGITDQSGAQIRDYFDFNGYTDEEETTLLPTIDAFKSVKPINISVKDEDTEMGIYEGASVAYCFAAYDKNGRQICEAAADKNDTYNNRIVNSGGWKVGLKETVTENDTDTVKDVDHYEFQATYYFGKYVIGTSAKKYPVSYDPEGITEYLYTADDSYTFTNETLTSLYRDPEDKVIGQNVRAEDGAKIQAVWTAYATDGSVMVTDQGSVGNWIGSKNFPLIQKFEVKQADGSVLYVDKKVDRYTQEVTVYYENTAVKKYTKTYQAVYFPVNVNDRSVCISQKDDVTYGVSTRNGEKVELEVSANTDVDSPLSYQWYAVKDGTAELIPGAIDSKYIAKLTDYDSVFCRITIEDGDALQKYLEKKQEENETSACLHITDIADSLDITYKAVETEGYVLLDKTRGEELESVLGESAKLFVTVRVDNGYTPAYRWQKKELDLYGNTIYTDIPDADMSEYMIAQTTEEDYAEDLYQVEITVSKGGEKIDTRTIKFTLEQIEKRDETLEADAFRTDVAIKSDVMEKGEDTTLKVVNNTDRFLADEWAETVDWYKKQEYTLIPKLDKEGCFTIVDAKTYTPVQGEVLVRNSKDDERAFVYLTAVGKVEDSKVTYVPDAAVVLPTDILGSAPVVFGDYQGEDGYRDKNEKWAYGKLVAVYWVTAASCDRKDYLSIDSTSLIIAGKDAAGNILNNDGQEYTAVYKITDKTDETRVSSPYTCNEVKISYDTELLAYAKNSMVTAEIDSSARLEVVALDKNEAVYPITYQWQKYYKGYGYKDMEGEDSAVLSFDAVKDTDYATYRVLVWDGTQQEPDENHAAAMITITLTNGNVYWLTNAYNRYKKSINDKVQLSVDGVFPKGVSNLTYRWYRNVTEIIPEENDRENDRNDWAILNADTNIYSYTLLSENDYGIYKCVVNYTLNGRVDGYNEFVFEVGPVHKGTELQTTTARETWKMAGDSVTYGVRIVSENPAVNKAVEDGKVTYTWYVNEKKVYGVDAASYTIESLSFKDGDEITVYCVVKSTEEELDWSDASPAFHTRHYSDIEAGEAQTVEGALGEDVTLEASFKNPAGRPLTYQWYMDGKKIPGAAELTYTVKNLGENEANANYECRAYFGETCEAICYVRIRLAEEYGWHLAANSSDYEINGRYQGIIGKSLTLSVIVKTEAETVPNLVYCWTKDGVIIEGAVSPKLELEQLSAFDGGTYICQAVDQKGSRNVVQFTVEVSTGLAVDSGYPDPSTVQAYETSIGGTVTLHAKASIESDGYDIFYQWYKGREALYNQTGDSLTLSEAAEDDVDCYYYCAVSDNRGLTKTLVYYVYVNTGLVIEQSVYYPTEDAEGMVTMFADVKANAGETLEINWYQAGKDKPVMTETVQADDRFYRAALALPEVTEDALGAYWVEVKASGESCRGDYELKERYTLLSSVGDGSVAFVEQNAAVRFDMKIVNAAKDAKYTYQWYAYNPITKEMVEQEVTASSYTANAPVLKAFERSNLYAEIPYGCVVSRNGVKQTEDGDYGNGGGFSGNIYTLNVFAKLSVTTSLPQTSHPFDKMLNAVKYVKSGAKELKITFDASSVPYVMVVGQDGIVHYLDEKRTATLSGEYAIIFITNWDSTAGSYGYKVSGIIDTYSAKATLSDKTVAYTGKAVTANVANVVGSKGTVTYIYYSDAACTKNLSGAPVNVGTYYVKAAVASDGNYHAVTSPAAKIVIKEAASEITLKAKKAAYTGKAISINKAEVKGSTGKVTYTYYTNAKCTKKTKKKTSGASKTGAAPKKAGTYYVKASVEADGNCLAATSKAVKLVIKKSSKKR